MSTGNIIFILDASKLPPNRVNDSEKFSEKKMKYLKKPRNPKLINMLVSNYNFLFVLSSDLYNWIPKNSQLMN